MDNEKDIIKQLFMETKAHNFDTFNNQWDNESRANGFFKPAYDQSVKGMYAGTSHTKFDLTFTDDMFKAETMFKGYGSKLPDRNRDEDSLILKGGGILEAIKDMTPSSRSLSMEDLNIVIKRMKNEPIPMGAEAIKQWEQFWDKQFKEWVKDGTVVIEDPIAKIAKDLNIDFNVAKHICILEFFKGVQFKGWHKIDRYKNLFENIRLAAFADKVDPSQFMMVKSRNVKTVSTEDAILALMNYYKIDDSSNSYKDFITNNTRFKTNPNIKQDMARNRRDKKKRPIKYAKP